METPDPETIAAHLIAFRDQFFGARIDNAALMTFLNFCGPRSTGIYIFHHENRCLYVGRSRHLYWRPLQSLHRIDKKLRTAKAATEGITYDPTALEIWIAPTSDEIAQEANHIHHLEPWANKNTERHSRTGRPDALTFTKFRPFCEAAWQPSRIARSRRTVT